MILLSFPLITEFKSQRIFIINEKGNSFNHQPSHAISCLALKTLHTLTEKLSTITIFGCRSGSGVNIPHYFEFIGIRMRSEMMEGVIQE